MDKMQSIGDDPAVPVEIASTIWATPNGDDLIAYMARVSNPKAQPGDPSAKLIGYLIDNHHWSPFAMCNLCVEINTTRDISAQILRHKSADFQEFSTRYADVEELLITAECRFQDDKNRQNSFEASAEDQKIVAWWDEMVQTHAVTAMASYKAARKDRVAKEVARRILPIGLVPTRLYMNGTVRTWIHYLNERTKPGVQKEHRAVALAVEHLFAANYPSVYQAVLNDRRKQAIMTELYRLYVNGDVTYAGDGDGDNRLMQYLDSIGSAAMIRT